MASPNLPEFDGPNLRIILAAGVTEVDIEPDVYSQWKEWFKLDDNAKFPPAFRTIGGDPLTSGIDAGAYFFIRNDFGWRIRPAEEDATILITGNLAPQDSTDPIAVPTLGDFTVLLLGLQPITQSVDTILEQSQDASYSGEVHVNTITGVSGTSWPVGTASDPVNNYADALTIAANLGLTKIALTGVISLTQTHNYWSFRGTSGVAVINTNGQDIGGSIFVGIGMTGSIANPSPIIPAVIERSQILSTGLFNFVGNIAQCTFDGDVWQGAGDLTIFDSASNVSGVSTPIVNANSSEGNLSIRGWIGGLEIQNFDQGNNCSIDLRPGHFVIGPTNTSGVIVLRGVGKFTDNRGSPQVTLNTDGFVSGEDIRIIKALTAGDAEVSLDDLTITIYDPDNITSPRTVLATYSMSVDGRIRTRTS